MPKKTKTFDLSLAETQLALMSEASRAPSVHNVQPAIWAFVPEKNQVLLYADPSRRLPVGDAGGNDNRMSLGAAFEGMKIAFSRHGLALSEPKLSAKGRAFTQLNELVASAKISDTGKIDPLAAFVFSRASYRGKFAPSTSKKRTELKRRLSRIENVLIVSDKMKVRELVEMGDDATAKFMGDPAYAKELFKWLRLSPKHPGWNRDGLNAEALALSRAERPLASLLMRPEVFGPLAKVGMGKFIIAESPQGVTADALLVLTAPRREDPFETGRCFYRMWLEACAAGYSLCPISALADSKDSASKITKMLAVNPEHRLVNVFRAGIRPKSLPLKLSPRLPAAELLRKVLPCST
jgi:nitroreductase